MKHSLGPITLLYPMPALLIGTYDALGKANVMTAAWGGICCSAPPCVAVSVRPERHTCQAIPARRAFTVSIAPCRLAAEVDYAGIVSGANVDKFAVTGLTAARSLLVDAPYVEECPVVLECELFRTLELGSHTQFVGRILDVKVDEDCLTPDGKPDIARIDPLAFDAGQRAYHSLGAFVGQAFSIGKRCEQP
ncbi:MAG: flavin reductase family protein [Deltaproteobacteria bacterium]|jgi:flavin reductase (DIM6/NTAB) family NADH-FMN oxidoreductase RutF|nr:flavin reductase family protein [Deltaproteobacteria bacterium]